MQVKIAKNLLLFSGSHLLYTWKLFFILDL